MKKLFITAAFLAFFGGINAQAQTTPGYTPTGFYDDFATDQEYSNQDETGVFWWETYEFDTISLLREDSSLKATISQQKGSYTPFGVSFSSDENVQKTIDLSQEAKIKFKVFNGSQDTLQIRLSVVDTLGREAAYTSGVNNDPSSPWLYEAASRIGSGETRDVIIDLTGGNGVDFAKGLACEGSHCLTNPDFSAIKSVHITVINGVLDQEDSYQPFAISGAKLKFSDFKIGYVEGQEQNLLLSDIYIPEDTTITPVDTATVVYYPVAHPDSVPVLLEEELNDYGFYDSFDSNDEINNGDGTGVFWFASENEIEPITLVRKDSVLVANVSQHKGGYTPFGAYFNMTSLEKKQLI